MKVLFGGVMAGGKGERFWPLSRETRPKQLLDIFTGRPLIEETVSRLLQVTNEKNILIVTTSILDKVLNEMFPSSTVLVEPKGKNTAPCALYTAFHVRERVEDALIAMVPSDHLIRNKEAFKENFLFGASIAEEGYLVTFGIPPTRPETGYGYIERDKLFKSGAGIKSYRVKKFHEKPDLKTAEEYVKSGNFYWNSGMFIWRADVLIEAFRKHAPEVYEPFEKYWPNIERIYEDVPDISVDYAIMEKASNIAVVEATFDWEDVGSFTSLERIFESDENGNVLLGEGIVLDGRGNIAVSQDGFVALLGVDDLIVVHTKDVTLVLKKEDAQRIKKLLKEIRKDEKKRKYLS